MFAVTWILIGLVICSLLIGSIATAFTSSTTLPKPSPKTLYGANVSHTYRERSFLFLSKHHFTQCNLNLLFRSVHCKTHQSINLECEGLQQ